MVNIFYIVAALLFVLLNGFFVAAEFSLVKLRSTRVALIKKNYGYRGKILAYVHQHLEAYLSSCQLGITLASLALGWIGEPAFAYTFAAVFTYFHIISPEIIRLISFIIAFAIISFLHIVLGELVPKSLAIRQAEKLSIWTAVPLYWFDWIMYPAIWTLNSSANYLLKLMGWGATIKGDYFYSTEEIKLILDASRVRGELTTDETNILEQTLDFADLEVGELMRPQDEMVIMDLHAPLAENLKIAAETRYSRYPIYDSKKQEMVGLIHVKDIFDVMYQHKTVSRLETYLRPVLKISPRMSVLTLLRKFREGAPHFALIYKNQDLIGFVTLDDLLHILIGHINDEFHRTHDDWEKNAEGNFVVRGDCPIYSLERALDRDIDLYDIEPEPETLTALIINYLGRMPEQNEVVEFKEFKAVVKKIRGSRILTVIVVPKPQIDE